MDQGAGEKPVPIQITVLRGKNMGVNKGESALNFVRAEFNSIMLGESQKLNASADLTLEYNFTCSFDCFGETNTLDDLAHKPVILTAVEILPKEQKKQKEEKTTVLGQGVVDLLPLLHGQRSFTSTVVLHPTPGSPAESASQGDNSKPSLDVTICATEPLLSDAQLSSSNLLRVLVEAAYAVPDVWSPAAPASYVVGFQVPLSAEKEQVLLLSKGLLKTGGEKEPLPRPKKWPLGPLLAPGADCIPGAFIEADPIEMESGELTGMEDREFRTEAEVDRKRVCWDTERRCFLDAETAACLTRRITHCRLWPVEIGRVPQTGLSRGGKPARDKAQVEDEAQLSFHGVVYVDLAPLLYPGVRRIHGAYSLHPFYEADMQDKTKRSTSILREGVRQLRQQGVGRAPPSVGSAPCRTASGKTLDKGAKGPKEATKKPGTQEKSLLPEISTDVDTPENIEGQMYTEARTYIVIEIALEKPLVPKRPPEELAKRVRELIAARPLAPRRPAGAERAVQQYQDQVASVAAHLLEQYQQLFGHALASGSHQLDPTAQEERKTQLIGELNYSGKYFAFKEQLKHSVVRIVREKMLCTEPFRDQERLQAFLSQLYVFLVDEMHVALNKTFLADPQDDRPPSQVDCTQLRHFAREAQLNQDYQLAATFYQERLARDQRNPEHWFDYGVFHMLTRDYLKAEECFREAVSISPVHLPSLLMCGILAEMAGRTEEAQTYLEGATCVDPTSVVAWTLSGLFYEGREDTIQAEMAFLEGNTQLRAAVAGTRPAEREFGAKVQEEPDSGSCDSSTTTAGVGEKTQSIQGIRAVTPGQNPSIPQPLCTPLRPNTSIYMETAHFLLENNALQMAQRALAQELLCPGGGPRCSYHLALARLQLMSGEFSSAEVSLQKALKDDIESPDTWAWLGHLHYLKGNYSQAQECYERTLDFVKDAADPHAVYLRLGQIYLQEKQFEKAKITHLQACKSSASCLSWLGVGAACYRLGELTEAEDALTEANALNNTDAEVWGYLSLVCLQTGRQLEAEQTYKYAMKLNLQKETLLQEIKDLQAQVGFGNPCF
nr:cilia- and flagella-associated protein 70 isoform X2 [Paramormyrops kingsleyae]